MDSRAIHEFFRFRNSRYCGPWYYTYPDGEDLPGKLSFCGQAAIIISAPIGLINAYTRAPYPTSQIGRWVRVARAVLPGFGMGMAFAIATYYATKYREKDDALNHCIGGAAAGLIFGAANGARKGFVLSLVLAAAAGGLKLQHQYMKPSTHSHRYLSPYTQRMLDFSGIPDTQGNWTKGSHH